MKNLKTLLLLVITISLSACTTSGISQSPTSPEVSPRASSLSTSIWEGVEDHEKISIFIDDRRLNVELVKTSESITQGLSGRDEIGSDGMLFVLPENQVPTFWMKEMKFDLDMIWVRQGKVIAISHNVPKPSPSTPLSHIPTVSPQQPADMVLEMVAGEAQRRGIKVGSRFVVGVAVPTQQ